VIIILTILKVRDVFNMRNEFIGQALMCILLTAAAFLTTDPQSIVTVLALSIFFSLGFTWPVILSYKSKSNTKRLSGLRLEHVLENPVYLKVYVEYCVKEFATEQPLFYGDILKFKQNLKLMINDEEKEKQIREIFRKYLQVDSVFQLNVPQSLVEALELKITNKEFTDSIFDTILAHVVDMMKDDSWVRFLRSNDFKMNCF